MQGRVLTTIQKISVISFQTRKIRKASKKLRICFVSINLKSGGCNRPLKPRWIEVKFFPMDEVYMKG